jgi:hypothetical protein
MPYSPELPKTEDGKVDWKGFKTKTQEIAKPLADLGPLGGVSFMPERGDERASSLSFMPDNKDEPKSEQQFRVETAQAKAKGRIVPAIKLARSLEIPATIPNEYKEKPFLPIMADLNAGGGKIEGIEHTGGPVYPLLHYTYGDKNDAVWASNRGAVGGILTSLYKSGAIYKEDGRLYALIAPYSMDQDTHKSNKQTSIYILKKIQDQIASGKLDKKGLDELINKIRSKKIPKKGQPLKSLPSFIDPSITDAYNSLSFGERAAIADSITPALTSKLGITYISNLLNKTRDPSYHGIERESILSLIKLDISRMAKTDENGDLLIVKKGSGKNANYNPVLRDDLVSADLRAKDGIDVYDHPSYDTIMVGKIVSHFNQPIPFDVGIPDMQNALRQTQIDKGIPENKRSTDAYLLTALPKGIASQKITPQVFDNINTPQDTEIHQTTARAIADAVSENWETLDSTNQKGAIEYIHAIKSSDSGSTLTGWDASTLKKALKKGVLRVFKLPQSEVWFGIKKTPEGKNELTGVMNNSGVGGMLSIIMAKAIQEGANTLDCFAVKLPKFPNGKLNTLYADHGWVVDRVEDFDPSKVSNLQEMKNDWAADGWDGQEMPKVVYMKHEGIGSKPSSNADSKLVASREIEKARRSAGGTTSRTDKQREKSNAGVAGESAIQGGNVLPRGVDPFIRNLESASPEQLRVFGLTKARRDAILENYKKGIKY